MNSALQDLILAEALGWQGTPFVHRASVRGAGADCLGLIRGIWRAVHGAEPWTLPPYLPQDRGVEHLKNTLRRHLPLRDGGAVPGDVLLFRLHPRQPPQHLGLCLPEGRFLHATAPAGVVAVHLAGPWQRRLCGSFILAPKGNPVTE